MALREDFTTWRNSFDEMSALGRVAYFVPILLGFLSIASIGDAVFRFKGFLLALIGPYKFISDLIVEFLGALGLVVSSMQVDILLVSSLVFGSICRSLRYGIKNVFVWLVLTGVSAAVVLLGIDPLATDSEKVSSATVVIVSLPVIAILMILVTASFVRHERVFIVQYRDWLVSHDLPADHTYWGPGRLAVAIWEGGYTILVMMMLVALLMAISEGLLRPS